MSSATFQPTISPNSLATIFGQGLSKTVTSAQLDSSGQLPVNIDGTSISVLGTLAPLVYVSPTQINFLVPAGTPSGLVTVTINSPLSSQPISITATVALVSPGIFTIPCLRQDRGAVLNGITFALEPFQTVTASNPGTDKRTRLSIFGTGLRYAGNPTRDPSVTNVASSVQVEATDLLGIVRKLPVEYAGAAPTFAGLDQINVIVPTDLEGAGLVRLRVLSGNTASNTVSIVLSQTLAAGILSNPSFNILTVAGSGNTGYGGDQGNAVQAQLQSPAAVAIDSHHNIYIADDASHVIRRVSPDGTITTYAGTGTAGSNGDGGLANEAQLRRPVALAMDTSGNLYIADADDHKIRRVSTNGTISTFAGNGSSGFSGDNGPATAAQLSSPSGVAVNRYGTVIIADTGNNSLRKVTGDGLISTFAGTGTAGSSGDGNAAYLAQLNGPDSVAVGADGTVFVADEGNLRVRRIAPDGTIRTVAGGGTVDLSAAGAPGSTTVRLQSPIRLSIDDDQRMFISDPQNSRIRVMDAQCGLGLAAGTGVAGFSGDGGPALSAQLNRPLGLAPDEAGNVFFADANNHRARELFAGNCSTPSVILFSPPSAVSAMTVNATVRLSCPVSADTVLLLSVDKTGLEIPVSVTVGAGQATASFSFLAPTVATETAFRITASNSQVSASGTIVISPPAGPFGIASLTLSPAVQTGGLPITGTLTLTAPSPAGGTMVALSSDNGAAKVLAAVFVPGGQLTTEFLVLTSQVMQRVVVTITASLGTQNVSASATLLPQGQAAIAGLSLSPSSVTGGMQDSTGTVTLTSAAPTGGIQVFLSSNNAAAAVPISITVPAGQTTATFEVSTSPVTMTTSVTISASSANTVTASLTINPVASGGGPGGCGGNLAGLSISPASVTGGTPATGTVSLNAPAPAGGLQVSLSSNGAAATVPSSVMVPAGQTSATFQVTTSTVTSTAQVTISATAGNSLQATLTVTPSGGGGGGQPGTIISLTISPSTVTGGTPAMGTVTLSAAAPAGGVTVSLSSNSSVATVPPSVTISSGQTSATFTVVTVPVLSSTTATITASAANTVSAGLTVNPVVGGSGNILSLTISPSTVIGGVPAMGTVTLTAAAPSGGVTVSLSSNSVNATVQPTVIVLAGQTSATFPVITLPVLASAGVTISATASNTLMANLTLNPVIGGGSGIPTLASLGLSASAVTGGLTTTGTVTLTAPAPAGGQLVNLTSNSLVAIVPGTVLVLSGQTSANFLVATIPVLMSTPVTIGASAGVSLSAMLNVNP